MVDFITKLLLVARRDIILVVYNRLSKIIYFVAIIEETSVEELVRLFRYYPSAWIAREHNFG